MSWIKQNPVPAGILGVTAVGVAGLGFMLYTAYSSYSENLEQFDGLNTSIAAMKGARLSPTPENLAAKQAMVEEFTKATSKLSLVLNALQKSPPETTDTGFQAKLKSKIAESKKFALDSGMGLPSVYNLAFDRYTAELPKSNDVATELSGYLDSVDEIVRLFAKSGVAQLDILERSELESEKAAPAPAPKPRQPMRPGAPQPPAPPKMAERRQVRAYLTTDQAALQRLMSGLASPSEMPYFTVVRLLRIENAVQQGPLTAEMRIQTSAASDTDAVAAVPAVIVQGATPAPAVQKVATPDGKDAQIVFGREVLKVFLEIDLVSFLPSQTAAAGARQ